MASNVLLAFLNQYIPSTFRDQIMAEIDSTGTVSDETLSKAGIKKKSTLDFIKSQIQDLAPRQNFEGLTRTQLQDILGTRTPERAVDEASLTTEGLQQRKDVFEALGKRKEDIAGYPSQVQDALKRKLSAYGVRDNVDAVAGQVFEIAQRLGRYPTAEELKNAFAKDTVFSRDANKAVGSEGGGSGWAGGAATGAVVGGPVGAGIGAIVGGLTGGGGGDTYLRKGYLPPELENFFNDQNATNELSSLISGIVDPLDTSSDVSRLEDLIKTRKEGETRDAEINKYIEGLPAELAQGRNERINLLRGIGEKQFQQMAPAVLARENAMGRLNSGAAGDALGSTYADIIGSVDSEAARLASEDEQFYFNAAYQNQVRKLMEGRTDFSNALNTERQNVRNQQNQRFQNTQFDLDKNLQNDLLMQKYQQQIQAAQEQRRRMQEIQSKRNSLGTAGGLGQLVGGIGGAVAGGLAGGPVGAGIGYSAGSAAGASLPLLFGSQR